MSKDMTNAASVFAAANGYLVKGSAYQVAGWYRMAEAYTLAVAERQALIETARLAGADKVPAELGMKGWAESVEKDCTLFAANTIVARVRLVLMAQEAGFEASTVELPKDKCPEAVKVDGVYYPFPTMESLRSTMYPSQDQSGAKKPTVRLVEGRPAENADAVLKAAGEEKAQRALFLAMGKRLGATVTF